MSDQAGSVTLIFHRIAQRWRDEHVMNILAALLTHSDFSHVEMAIGEVVGQNGVMTNVIRIFNDDVGVVSGHSFFLTRHALHQHLCASLVRRSSPNEQDAIPLLCMCNSVVPNRMSKQC